jgi:hypothetical protein
MNYIIVSKDVRKGTSKSDIPDPCSVTEIATELIITRLYLLSQLSEGKIDINDTVVCANDRQCLYTKIFPNVITFAEFNSRELAEEDTVEDYLNPYFFDRLAAGDVSQRLIPYLPFYQNYERDKNLINTVDWSDLQSFNTSKPFVGLVIRKRGAWEEKNLADDFWRGLIRLLEDNNIQTFVFGKETELFCNTPNTVNVNNYRDWCTLLTHPNCRHVGSTMTGGVFPLLVFGNPSAKMTLVDNLRLMDKHGHDPSFYHPCINFSKIDISFINHIPTIEDYYERITKDL